MSGTDDSPQILRPLPRRPFELNLTPASSGSDHSTPATGNPTEKDSLAAQLDARLRGDSHRDGGGGSGEGENGSSFSRTRSILNLTSSTLFGIYQSGGESVRDSEPATPWGTGAETPARGERGELDWEQLRAAAAGISLGGRDVGAAPGSGPGAIGAANEAAAGKGKGGSKGGSIRPGRARAGSQQGAGSTALPVAARSAALFVFGVAYGLIISHLHDNQHISPVRVEGIDRGHWGYLAFWGVAGVALGNLLPWVDLQWEGEGDVNKLKTKTAERKKREGENDWSKVVRSIGAFGGIAFAIRRLPWQSTLQVSLTLALVNPALWYILDRSKPGFTLSSLVGLAGTAVMLLLGPDVIVPSPPIMANHTAFSVAARNSNVTGAANEYEGLGVATWFASVLFCSCVCFGNIGRKLAVSR